MPPEGYYKSKSIWDTEYNGNNRLTILEARLREIRAMQVFKDKYPNATVGEIESFKMGYQAANQ